MTASFVISILHELMTAKTCIHEIKLNTKN